MRCLHFLKVTGIHYKVLFWCRSLVWNSRFATHTWRRCGWAHPSAPGWFRGSAQPDAKGAAWFCLWVWPVQKGQSSASTASSSSPWHRLIFLHWHTSLHTQHINMQRNNHVTNCMSHAKGEQSLLQWQLEPCQQRLWCHPCAPSFPEGESLEPAHF